MSTPEELLAILITNLLVNAEGKEHIPQSPGKPLVISTDTLSRLSKDAHAAQKLAGFKGEVYLTLPAAMELIRRTSE